jgi:dihydroorotate dehydrogenase (NAD+) catalytic subunit
MSADLSTQIGTVNLKNPIVLASGPKGGSSHEGMRQFLDAGWGGIVTKTVTKEPSKGWPTPSIIDFYPHYMINAQGGPNPGYVAFADEIRFIKQGDAPVFVSVAADSTEDFIMICKHLIEAGANGIELNVSCAHTPGRARWSTSYQKLKAMIKSIRENIDKPIWVKLPSTRMADIPKLAEMAAMGGADCIVPFNTVPGMAIDIKTGKPRLGNPHGVGSISGKAIKPLGLRAVLDTVRVVDIPVIGTGGIEDGLDVVEYLMAGASAVQIQTLAIRKGAEIIDEIIRCLKGFMEQNGYVSIREIIGRTLQFVPKLPLSYIEGF